MPVQITVKMAGQDSWHLQPQQSKLTRIYLVKDIH